MLHEKSGTAEDRLTYQTDTLYIDPQKLFRAKDLGADAISVFFDNYT